MDEAERAARTQMGYLAYRLAQDQQGLRVLLSNAGIKALPEVARKVALARTQVEFGKLVLRDALQDLGGNSDPTGAMLEQLAAYAHDAWAKWMKYLFDKSRANPDGSVTIPAALVTRWQRQMKTDYADLPAADQASDLTEADKMLAIVEGGLHS